MPNDEDPSPESEVEKAMLQLGSLLAQRVGETTKIHRMSLASAASITPGDFTSLTQTYERLVSRLQEGIDQHKATDGVRDLLEKKMPQALVLKFTDYRDLNAIIGAFGLGLAQLGLSISIQLPLQGHLMDMAEFIRLQQNTQKETPHDGEENLQTTETQETQEERPEVDDDLGAATATGPAGGSEGGSEPGSPTDDGGTGLDGRGLGDGGVGPVAQR